MSKKLYSSNSGAYVVHSLNKGSQTSYLLAQIRTGDKGQLHVQVRCPKYPGKNRAYGFAFDVVLNPGLSITFGKMQQWCLSGELTEPETDEHEYEESIADIASKIPKCPTCGEMMCICKHCHKCENLDKNGFPKVPEVVIVEAVEAEGDEEDDDAYPKCSACDTELCSQCGKCHSCNDLNKYCEKCCPECGLVLCGECMHCHHCEDLNEECNPMCPECEEVLCPDCGHCHSCDGLNDDCDPISDEPPNPETSEELIANAIDEDLASFVLKALAEQNEKMKKSLNGELGKVLGVKFMTVGYPDFILTPQALKALSVPDEEEEDGDA